MAKLKNISQIFTTSKKQNEILKSSPCFRGTRNQNKNKSVKVVGFSTSSRGVKNWERFDF